jgi:dolichyl-phosphate-mannose-protein mannosyltransferase
MSRSELPAIESSRFLPAALLAAGLVLRVIPAARTFLNPDEALHYSLAAQSSVSLAYQQSLTQAHPPLLILLLYYWRVVGHSELLLRLPSLLAGTAFCWLGYRWLEKIAGRGAALAGLLLFSLAPSLILLSAEVRQYGLLLFFLAACLYLAETAVQNNSCFSMALFSLALCGALLSHYSAFLFAFATGVYMLVRLYPYRERGLSVVWATGQVLALALCLLLFRENLSHFTGGGLAHDMDTWLRKSFFHPGEENVLTYVLVQTLRVFTNLFSQGFVGSAALVVFVAGLAISLRRSEPLVAGGPAPRLLALFILLPFVTNCLLGLAGKYPYAGTRHNSFLAPFAIAGMAVALAAWKPSWPGMKITLLLAAMAACNLFPAPGPAIRPRNQSKERMARATKFLRQSAGPGAYLIADTQSALLLGYYVCGHAVIDLRDPRLLQTSDCGAMRVIASRVWAFGPADFPSALQGMAETSWLTPQANVWLFSAGWRSETSREFDALLQSYGCPDPRRFGDNIMICEIRLVR